MPTVGEVTRKLNQVVGRRRYDAQQMKATSILKISILGFPYLGVTPTGEPPGGGIQHGSKQCLSHVLSILSVCLFPLISETVRANPTDYHQFHTVTKAQGQSLHIEYKCNKICPIYKHNRLILTFFVA